MSDNRTPPWLIQLRFFALCSPVGIILAILLAPFALPILLGFGGTLFLAWHGSRLFTNGVVKAFDPEGYKAMKNRGCDPFCNSLGAPLNNDSETVRIVGTHKNASCPNCQKSVKIEANASFRCPSCNTHWHENQW